MRSPFTHPRPRQPRARSVLRGGSYQSYHTYCFFHPVHGARLNTDLDSAACKTLENLQNGSAEVNFLFFAKDYSAYQLKGRARYANEGPLFEEGQCLAKPEFALRGVVEIEITQVYKGSERL